MSKRTIALIALLIVATGFLLALAITPQKPTTTTQSLSPTKIPAIAESILSISPNPLVLTTGTAKQGSVNIELNSGKNKVTAVQLELSYDPLVLKNVEINTASSGAGFFESPNVLLKNIDDKNGRITFLLGITPTGNPKTGIGTVAVLTFSAQSNTPGQTEINFLPKSLVTANGITSSVLKQTLHGIVIFEGSTPTQIPSSQPTQ